MIRSDKRALVVGAGVIGSAIALELSRAGWAVTVIDKFASAGAGSTSASSAIVRYHYNHLPETALAWEAGKRWMDWGGYLGSADPRGLANFIRSGALVLDGALMDREVCLENLRALEIPVEELTPERLRELFPALDISELGPPARVEDDAFWRDPAGELGAYWVPDAGHVDDPQLAALNLAHAAAANGAVFRFKATMRELVVRDGRVGGVVLEDGTTLEADVVINAAGPWSQQVNRIAGALSDFAVSTRPLEQEVISLPLPEGFELGASGTCINDADFGTYFRPHGHTLIVGGMEPECDPLVFLDSPEDARASVRADTWEVQSLRIARRIHGAKVPSRPSGIVGVYDVTEDWIPIYDRTAIPGFYVAIGTSGHGFKQAPIVGEIVARLVDACENGHDHDRDPLTLKGSYSGAEIDLGHFSRLRTAVPQFGMS
ncbi:FAD-dependent oxidoreductase [Kribbella solani]|uniref:Glycine/D-amino acid oxidase-like deaminating enzyme n=1 Tax=Kribbella solani TaxID=236067 RepID=A0A841DVY4_9ACTN|nr:glycine/D-amino acid oxidase-like deaminating enzyme [Kribbella solani]